MLIDNYDAALFDLDGVVYLGPNPVPAAPQGLAKLRDLGKKIGFVTNNAARPAETVAAHLESIGIACQLADVVTSAQAGAKMVLAEMEPGAKVFVVGTEALADELEKVGLTVVDSIDQNPAAVVQGYHPNMTQGLLDDGAIAIQHGARWFACNNDSTRPTDRGIVAGVGAQINTIANTTDVRPMIAGKPFAPLLNETVARLETTSPIFVGDRIDTDIMGAVNVGMDSLFVFTGAHGVKDLIAAPENGRPSHIGYDLAALLEPERHINLTPQSCCCGDQQAVIENGEIKIGSPETLAQQLDCLWAILQLVWRDNSLDASCVFGLDKLH